MTVERKIGNTRIQIADDHCRDKTEADVREILARIALATQQHFCTAAKQNATTTTN